MAHRIHRLRIVNYRGVEGVETAIGPHGVIIKGANMRGKTSVLRAIRAALIGRDIGADAIRVGAERAEILVDLGDATVKRVITSSSTTLTVDRAGKREKSPQAWLTELLGTSPLDPIELFAAKAKDRRAIVLGALPLRLTPAQVFAWVAADAFDDFTVTLDSGFDKPTTLRGTLAVEHVCTRHGLEAIAELREHFYTERTAANRDAKSARKLADDQWADHAKLAQMVPSRSSSAPAPNRGQADSVAKAAADRYNALVEQHERAKQQDASLASTREKVSVLRDEAKAIAEQAQAPSQDERAKMAAEWDAARVAHEAAKERWELAVRARHAMLAAEADATKALAEAASKLRLADDLEATMRAVTVAAPTNDEIEEAAAEKQATEAAAHAALLIARANAQSEIAGEATKRAREAEAKAGKLDTIVAKLTDAPAELMKASPGALPGLSIVGDAIMLDGVAMDGLSGREQLRFAVEITRRANEKSRILIVDKLEALDPDQLADFVQHATRDGFQLIATRVDRGEVVLEAIAEEHEDATDEAAPS